MHTPEARGAQLPHTLAASRGWRLGGALSAPLLTLLVLAGVQEGLARSGLINARKFPPVSQVLEALLAEISQGRLWSPLAQTLGTWALAVLISFALALLLGIGLGSHRVIRAATTPIIEFIRPVPSTALIPLVVLTLGSGVQGALFLTCFGTVWQILPSIFRGLGQVEAVADDTARAFSFSRWQRLRWLVVPSMLPFLWTALRLGAAAALVLLISMELLAGINGIGHEIANAYAGANTPTLYAYILVAALIGGVVNLLLTAYVKRRTGSQT